MENNKKCIFFFIGLLTISFLISSSAQDQKVSDQKKSWFTATPVAESVWCIDDHGSDNIYLVEGNSKALLIDTGTGVADLAAFVKSITKLPVIVVNTHGHPDHAGGNYQFEQIFAHPLDSEMMAFFTSRDYHQSEIQQWMQQSPDVEPLLVKDIGDFQISSVQPIDEGFIFDLGGRKLEVITTPGHTQGSVCLLDAQNKLLFAGDNDNSLVWLFLKGCLPLEVYLQSLQKLQHRNAEFDTILPGHGQPLDRAFLDEQIICVQNILQGECKGEPYTSFAGDGLKCSYKRASIAYDPLNLFVKQ